MLQRIRRQREEEGFTLIELLIVMALLGVLVAVLLPKYQDLTPEAKIAATQQNLESIRSAVLIYASKNQGATPYPDHLDSLVAQGYLRRMPVEKISGSTEVDLQSAGNDNTLSPNDDGGWLYNPTTGGVYVDVVDIQQFITNYSGDAQPFYDW
ncbi:MAG: prepilin-type N-terminal cleavage/methylation domain-containing protein [bacterium]